jgi:hypothetical protein
MAKKTPAAKPATDGSKQLMDAIATVRQIQEFIKERGSLEAALAAVARVQGLTAMTGGFEPLKQALEIVGKESAPPQA